jgi:hypothetical protein
MLSAVLKASVSGGPLTAEQHIFSRPFDRVHSTIPKGHLRAGSSTGSARGSGAERSTKTMILQNG